MEENTEKKAIDALLDNGISVKVQNKGLRRFIKKESVFIIKQPTLGVLLNISKEVIKLDIDEKQITENPLAESWRSSVKSIDPAVKAVAYAIIGGGIMYEIRAERLARRLKWCLTPSKILDLVLVLTTMCNTADFLNSIRLTRGIRMTEPPNLSLTSQGG